MKVGRAMNLIDLLDNWDELSRTYILLEEYHLLRFRGHRELRQWRKLWSCVEGRILCGHKRVIAPSNFLSLKCFFTRVSEGLQTFQTLLELFSSRNERYFLMTSQIIFIQNMGKATETQVNWAFKAFILLVYNIENISLQTFVVCHQ